jgi:hypothetical protein
MKRRIIFRSSIVAALCIGVLLGLAGPAGAATSYSNGFESDTAGWSEFAGYGTITRQASGYDSNASILPYADDIPSSSGGFHARLERGACDVDNSGHAPTPACYGAFTDWGGVSPPTFPVGGYTTQVDIYLDAAYADAPANADDYDGDLVCLTTTSPNDACIGSQFGYTSAINGINGSHLRDFGFNVSTGPAGDDCPGFTVNGTTNVFRSGANPNTPGHDPQCIAGSGWYTFKHTFSNVNDFLNVQMDIIDVDTSAVAATWTITNIDPISTVGCERYGWFANQEIPGLPIDNASMSGCGTPNVGKITPTGTTCQQYRDGVETPPVQLLYTTRSGNINAVSPGVFFYYTKVSGDQDQSVDITQDNDATTAPTIPINQGQVVLYDANTCKVVKWSVELGDGTATGTLPRDGNFIIGVKYSPSSLKGQPKPVPPTVTYTFGAELDDVLIDEATVDLVPKA